MRSAGRCWWKRSDWANRIRRCWWHRQTICDVEVAPGSLAALRHRAAAEPIARHPHGLVLPLSALEQVRFLRISTLSVAPRHRARAFGMQFRRQMLGNMMSPQSTTLDDLAAFATRCVQAV